MSRYTVKDQGIRYGIRGFIVSVDGQPEWEQAGVWVGRGDKPRCASCSGLLVAMSASCPHARAVVRFLKARAKAKGATMTKAKLVRCEIRFNNKTRLWEYRERVDGKWQVGPRSYAESYPLAAKTKAAFQSQIKKSLAARVEQGEYGFSLYLFDKGDTRYRREITIPRAHDPKRSKG